MATGEWRSGRLLLRSASPYFWPLSASSSDSLDLTNRCRCASVICVNDDDADCDGHDAFFRWPFRMVGLVTVRRMMQSPQSLPCTPVPSGIIRLPLFVWPYPLSLHVRHFLRPKQCNATLHMCRPNLATLFVILSLRLTRPSSVSRKLRLGDSFQIRRKCLTELHPFPPS